MPAGGMPIRRLWSACGFMKLVLICDLPIPIPGAGAGAMLAIVDAAGPLTMASRTMGFEVRWSMPAVLRIEGLSECGLKRAVAGGWGSVAVLSLEMMVWTESAARAVTKARLIGGGSSAGGG